jgi:hypothetical protein
MLLTALLELGIGVSIGGWPSLFRSYLQVSFAADDLRFEYFRIKAHILFEVSSSGVED